jgi:hypothetical protein
VLRSDGTVSFGALGQTNLTVEAQQSRGGVRSLQELWWRQQW